MTSQVERRMAEMGLALPLDWTPRGQFLPFRKDGTTVYLSGQICEWDGTVTHDIADRALTRLGVDHLGLDGAEIGTLLAVPMLARFQTGPMIAVWSAVLFASLWLLLAGMGVAVAITIARLERDDGPWRRGL